MARQSRIMPGPRIATSLLVAALAATWSFVAMDAPAQEPGNPAATGQADSPKAAEETTDNPRELIQTAYKLTKTAARVDEFTEIIGLCTQAQASTLSASNAEYVRKLLSWAENRRGELYADEAAKLAGQGDEDAAHRLDAQALDDFEAAIKHDPTRWKAIHNRGVSRALHGEYEPATSDFTRVIQLNASYANAWFNRAEIRYELGEYEQAVSDYDEAIRRSPNDVGAYTSRGHTYFKLRRMREALADYQRAVQLAPEDGNVRANRADAYLNLGQWEQAARDYRGAIDLDKSLARAYQGAAWLMATCPDARYRNTELAVQSAERAVQLAGEDDFRYLDTLAAAYANASRYEDAVRTAEKAVEMAPEEHRASVERRRDAYRDQQPFRQAAAAAAAGTSARRP